MKFAFALCLLLILGSLLSARAGRTPAKSCYCITVYQPVCASNGKIYSNECFMKCAGEKKGSNGACSHPPKDQ